ncbi:MAG: family 43 glycosylhydrolase [Tannerellaceae bacterium]|jgi:beta-xylosidase|nr:family 43 glycosylhydrolase [Tannerellaceae bacterium]
MRSVLAIILLVSLACQVKAQRPDLLFPGDYPDPSILRDGENYYVVHSSFEYSPGLLIWHSTDLRNWRPVTHALHTYVGPVWAPDLVKYDGKYYIYFPVNNTNYVVTANSIEGPWSDPVDLKTGNIDPGHVVDAEGNRYLYFSSGGYVPLAKDGLSVTGKLVHTYDGWPIPRDWTIECFCMEGPKIVKRGEYYYLTVAEGGTAGPPTSHMIISARSRSPFGPWENSPHNPIIKTKDKAERWWSKGHGTLFEDKAGDWWMLYHAFENGFYNMGRQTLIEPVEWTVDGWFKTPDSAAGSLDGESQSPVSGTAFSLTDDFSGPTLGLQWQSFGAYTPDRYRIEHHSLTMKAKGRSVQDSPPLLCIPSHHSYTVDVEISTEGNTTAGLMLFYNPNFHSGILANSRNILANLRGWQFVTERNVINNHTFLRLKKTDNIVDMFYSPDGKEWIKIENSIEVSSMHHNVLSGFLSLRIGLCAIGDGSAKFKNFVYTPLP